MKASDGLFLDSVVYVTTQGTQVGTDGGKIVVRDVEGDDGELGRFATEKLETINVFGGVNFSTPFVAEANEHGIVLNYFTQRGKYRGSFVPERNTIAEVRRAQYALDEVVELAIAKAMIRAKIRNARTLLSRKGITGTDVLRDLGERVSQATSKDDLRGTEGEAAERYFDRLDETLVDGWTFETRSKRPPEDHINSLLSLTYVMMQYYYVCERELWFESRNVEIDRENASVARGTRVDESLYGERSQENLRLGMIALDLLEDGRVVEVKPSSTLTEPARMQLSYYLWYLDRVLGVEREGVLAHPTERRREDVSLNDDRREKVESAIRGIHAIVTADSPPEATEKPYCESCAYHDFCWV